MLSGVERERERERERETETEDNRREWEKKERKKEQRTAKVETKEKEGGENTLSVEGWRRHSCLTLADLSLLKQGNEDSTELTHALLSPSTAIA